MKIHFKLSTLLIPAFSAFCLLSSSPCSSQASKDTIRVMAYNTLDFGDCQSASSAMYADLRAIIKFANPDIVGLDKLACVNTSPSDNHGILPYTFPDTVISKCFNTSFAFCPFTDLSGCSGGNSDILFFNQNKLGYLSTTPLYWGSVNAEDIDLFKFYYKQWFVTNPDTTYLYVALCHTVSGSSSSGRDHQDSTVMNYIRTHFTHTPNFIFMGDFNTHTSTEPGYEYITQTSDTSYTMDDPSFRPDAKLSYPDNWGSGTSSQAYFTTSTRTNAIPNSCGTTGGAKNWYDHIFLSPSIVNGNDNFTYVRNSYKTIGNNGNRANLNVNDSTTNGKNTCAPSDVLNALFNFSDKYPVEVTLAVNSILGVANILEQPGNIKVNNPINNNSIVLHFAQLMNGENITMDIYDVCGRDLYKSSFVVNSSLINKNILLAPGVYMLHFTSGGYSTTLKVVKQ